YPRRRSRAGLSSSTIATPTCISIRRKRQPDFESVRSNPLPVEGEGAAIRRLQTPPRELNPVAGQQIGGLGSRRAAIENANVELLAAAPRGQYDCSALR